MAEPAHRPCIQVLAGTNGAGKSSIGGAYSRAAGSDYFNPDEVAREIRAANPGMSVPEANSAAWHEGRRQLERAISERSSFAFESTLGGSTIPNLLKQALLERLGVRVWYVGLAGPELHIERVRARVAAGGHDIPDVKIRERYESCRRNLVQLLSHLTELQVYDNSAASDPRAGKRPRPLLLLHMQGGRIVTTCAAAQVPNWAKPILAAALRLSPSHSI